MDLRTSRLELIPATAELLRLEDGSPLALAIPLNAVIPIEWPPEEVRGVLGFFADQMDAGVTGDSWVNYCWIAHTTDGAPPVLVGSGGFKSKPVNGLVELGYGTLKQFQRQGYATEAVSALTQWGLSQPDVARVAADALPENAASVRVLAKNGFAEAGPGEDEGTRRFEIAAPI